MNFLGCLSGADPEVASDGMPGSQEWDKLPWPKLGSINSLYFHIVGDGKLNPIVGVYIPIIRIPY